MEIQTLAKTDILGLGILQSSLFLMTATDWQKNIQKHEKPPFLDDEKNEKDQFHL